MSKTLVILEVSRKQDYIFASQRLRNNAARSEVIRYVTSEDFFLEAAPDLYKKENMVYSGGGHTVLQFDTAEAATEFNACVTQTAMQQYAGLELFARQAPYDPNRKPGENIRSLIASLEKKKASRRDSFRRLTFGVEKVSLDPDRADISVPRQNGASESIMQSFDGRPYPADLDLLCGRGENFLAVVHIDGNAMGRRVDNIYQTTQAGNDWDSCCRVLRAFSEGIQADFEAAFRETVREIVNTLGPKNGKNRGWALPIRPVILAGDDVCFVCSGSLGLECARIFLEKLSARKNPVDHEFYSACAGVAMVHKKYSFRRAYDLAEELCDNAKRFGSQFDPERRRISAMDWHLEFGQLKGTLSEIREDYETDDKRRLELRPVYVLKPKDITETPELEKRSYQYFTATFRRLQNMNMKVARSKIKNLRNAMKQGIHETRYFIDEHEIGEYIQGNVFQKIGDTERSLYYDAVEMLDHFQFIRKEARS